MTDKTGGRPGGSEHSLDFDNVLWIFSCSGPYDFVKKLRNKSFLHHYSQIDVLNAFSEPENM